MAQKYHDSNLLDSGIIDMTTLRLMTIQFDLPLRYDELDSFRGAIIQAVGKEHTLYHNHSEKGYLYHYPLIQYRIFNGKAAILCINDGIEQIQFLFSSNFLIDHIFLNNIKRGPLSVENVRIKEFCLKELDAPIEYHIKHWIPLNQKNYQTWQELKSKEERLAELEAILTGNIISFAKGVNWQIEHRFWVTIRPGSIVMGSYSYKGCQMISMTLDFRTNLSLPLGIGLGKDVILNHGILSRHFSR